MPGTGAERARDPAPLAAPSPTQAASGPLHTFPAGGQFLTGQLWAIRNQGGSYNYYQMLSLEWASVTSAVIDWPINKAITMPAQIQTEGKENPLFIGNIVHKFMNVPNLLHMLAGNESKQKT